MKNCLFFGISTIDLIYELDKNPRYNEKIKSNEFLLLSGGQALNSSITNSVLGGNSTLISFVGQSKLSSVIHDELLEFSINYYDLFSNTDVIPPISSIFISNNEKTRTIITNKIPIYSNANFSLFESIIKKNDILYIDGYYIDTCIEVAKIAKKHKKTIVFDGGTWKDGFNYLIKYADIIICSGNFFPPNTKNQKERNKFLKEYVATRIYTNGNNPIVLDDNNITKEIPIEKINVVDTLGAGDIFQGAFCYYLSKNKNIFQCANSAAKIASFSCLYLGTREWIKKLSLVSG